MAFIQEDRTLQDQIRIWKRRLRDCKSQRDDDTTSHSRTDAHMESQRLRQHANDLRKVKPEELPVLIGLNKHDSHL